MTSALADTLSPVGGLRAALNAALCDDIRSGSLATGRGKLEVQPCPQCPVSDGRPEKGGLS